MDLGVASVHAIPGTVPRVRSHRHVRPEQRPMTERRRCEKPVRTKIESCATRSQRSRPVHERGRTRDRGEFGIAAEGAVDVAGPGRRGDAVGIQPQDQVSRGGVVPRRTRCRDPRHRAADHAGSRRPGDRRRLVGGGVVDDDHLVGRKSLTAERLQASLEQDRIIAYRDDDGQPRGRDAVRPRRHPAKHPSPSRGPR